MTSTISTDQLSSMTITIGYASALSRDLAQDGTDEDRGALTELLADLDAGPQKSAQAVPST